jgi:Ca2+/H+ antiporter, TMEM165/GDT1 family
MDWRLSLTVFTTIFIAEMGDKTQLAVLTMTASSAKPFSVFIGAAAALTLVTVLGVLLGGVVTQWIPETALKKAAALLFVGLGIWIWFRG